MNVLQQSGTGLFFYPIMSTKDPAFLFYPKDWIQGTAKLMPEEKGVYIDLLAHQHQDGDLPNNTKRLARIVGLSESEFLPIWEGLKSKFIEKNDNRLVNRKLTELMTERSDKGTKNKIIGTLAAVVRLSSAPYDVKFQAKKTFDYSDFLEVEQPKLTESITEWFEERLKSIANGNGNAIGNDIISKYWFLKFYNSDYNNYVSVFNGQSTTENYFKQWKAFIDFIYKNKYEDIFECKFISPHDFAKVTEKDKFTVDKWDEVIKAILATGIKPEHNLFFRIPQFLGYDKNNKNGTGIKQAIGTTKFNAGANELLDRLKGKATT